MSFRLRPRLHYVALACFLFLPIRSFALPGTVLVRANSSTPVRAGEVFRVTMLITEYTEPIEIDGFRFNVSFPTDLFAFVPGSERLTDDFGTDQQWLSKANQETPAQGFQPTSLGELQSPGVLEVYVRDTGTGPVERGTLAFSGFLYSFELLAQGEGTGLIRAFPFEGQSGVEALYATSGVAVETPSFGAAIKTVQSGIHLSIRRVGSNIVLRWPTTPAGFSLQQRSTLTAASSWVDSTEPVMVVNGEYQVTVPASGAQRYFRLHN